MRSSSQQSFTALPNGPSTSSTNTRNSKLEQIIQVKNYTLPSPAVGGLSLTISLFLI